MCLLTVHIKPIILSFSKVHTNITLSRPSNARHILRPPCYAPCRPAMRFSLALALAFIPVESKYGLGPSLIERVIRKSKWTEACRSATQRSVLWLVRAGGGLVGNFDSGELLLLWASIACGMLRMVFRNAPSLFSGCTGLDALQ